MKNTIESSTKTAIRVTISTSRYTAKKNEIVGSTKETVGSVVILNDGKQTTVGGYGNLFEKFLKTKKLDGYTGQMEPFTSFSDPNYDHAKLKVMKFDETYHKMPYDARSRKCAINDF